MLNLAFLELIAPQAEKVYFNDLKFIFCLQKITLPESREVFFRSISIPNIFFCTPDTVCKIFRGPNTVCKIFRGSDTVSKIFRQGRKSRYCK